MQRYFNRIALLVARMEIVSDFGTDTTYERPVVILASDV